MGEQLQIIQYGDKYGLFAADGELIEGDFTSREEALAAREKPAKSGNGRRKKAEAKEEEEEAAPA